MASHESGNDHMSDLTRINTGLERLFNGEGQPIVFWGAPTERFVIDQVISRIWRTLIRPRSPNCRSIWESPNSRPCSLGSASAHDPQTTETTRNVPFVSVLGMLPKTAFEKGCCRSRFSQAAALLSIQPINGRSPSGMTQPRVQREADATILGNIPSPKTSVIY